MNERNCALVYLLLSSTIHLEEGYLLTFQGTYLLTDCKETHRLYCWLGSEHLGDSVFFGVFMVD